MELRKDYILDRWVIISENRGKRPNDFVSQEQAKKVSCVFCAGKEDQTPSELYRHPTSDGWSVRVIPNKYSAVDPRGDPTIQTHNTYYTFAGDHGEHEIVIETPLHGKDFGDLSESEIMAIMKTYALRVALLEKKESIQYVCVFKNQGKEAGASINHPHSQIISLSMIPPFISEKTAAIKKYPACPYCDIISREKDSYRRCFENNSCISFTPYASRFNYEAWLFPKRHVLRFEDFDDALYADMASMLKALVQKLEKQHIDYDLAWYYSPRGENLHFHVEVMPRIALWAGFEIGFGVTINTISPEMAAQFYRGEA